jgi:hypothetical protein
MVNVVRSFYVDAGENQSHFYRAYREFAAPVMVKENCRFNPATVPAASTWREL